MNIDEALRELIQTFRVYLARDEYGALRMPPERQRPVLLMGPPGVGKTAILHQAAEACGLNLVCYTMTHLTRQSAVGLPRIVEREYDGQTFSVTEYTLSEIIASVYEARERSGLPDGVLFLDEFNCVSETLAPAMLEFLQYKRFGNHALPEGWIVAAAGNPAEYNDSARELDPVTLDRVKQMVLEPDVECWRRYAARGRLHPAILGYLALRPEHFYAVSRTGASRACVTARAWEDLSEMLLCREALELPVPDALHAQYLQSEEVASAFSVYYRLFARAQGQWRPEQILAGGAAPAPELKQAEFGERLAVVEFLAHRLTGMSAEAARERALTGSLDGLFGAAGEAFRGGASAEAALNAVLRRRDEAAGVRRRFGLISAEETRHEAALRALVTRFLRENASDGGADPGEALGAFLKARRLADDARADEFQAALEHALAFIEGSLSGGFETLIFVTELSEHAPTREALRRRSCARFEAARRALLPES